MDFTKEGEILYGQAPIALLPKNTIRNHLLNEGDVLIVTTADCGLTAVFENQDFSFIPSAYTVKYKFNSNINPFFIKYYMTTSPAMEQVRRYVRQGTLGNLPGSDLFRFEIQIPERPEQDEIVKRIDTIHLLLRKESKFLDKLIKIKRGLMQDLLTGKTRVKV